MNRAITVIFALTLLASLVLAIGEKPKTPIAALDFTLKDLSGKPTSLNQFKGKTIVLNFWATWCPPCWAELPYFQKLSKEIKGKDMVLITIDVGESPSQVKAVVEEEGIDFLVLLDPDGEVAGRYFVHSFPTTYIIDKQGNILGRVIGAQAWNKKLVESLLERGK